MINIKNYILPYFNGVLTIFGPDYYNVPRYYYNEARPRERSDRGRFLPFLVVIIVLRYQQSIDFAEVKKRRVWFVHAPSAS